MIDRYPGHSYVVAYMTLTWADTEAMTKITNRWLDSLRRPDHDVVIFDDSLPRFGVRLTPNGAISFLVQYRNAQGKSRRLTIGRYGQPWPLAEARKHAKRLLAEADSGLDPVRLRQDARKAVTFADFAEAYIERCEAGLVLTRKGKPKRPSTIQIDRYRIPHLVAFFKDRPVRDISHTDCQQCLGFLIRNKHGATRTFGLLGGMLADAVKQGEIEKNPAHGIQKPTDGQREFRLSAAGYRELGENLCTAERNGELWQATAAIQLLALTGCRKSEILRLRWAEVDFDGRALRLDEAKSAARVRPLGKHALQLLQQIKARLPRDAEFVLPGPKNSRKPFNGMGGSTEGAWVRIVGSAYSPHGLRHAFGGTAGDLGYSDLVIGALLGNGQGGITQRYVKLDRILTSAADRINQWIAAAMDGEINDGENPSGNSDADTELALMPKRAAA